MCRFSFVIANFSLKVILLWVELSVIVPVCGQTAASILIAPYLHIIIIIIIIYYYYYIYIVHNWICYWSFVRKDLCKARAKTHSVFKFSDNLSALSQITPQGQDDIWSDVGSG